MAASPPWATQSAAVRQGTEGHAGAPQVEERADVKAFFFFFAGGEDSIGWVKKYFPL